MGLLKHLAPQLALKMEAARYQLKKIERIKAYENGGASKTKKVFRRWRTKSGSADDDIGKNKKTLQERSADLYMNTTLGSAAIKKIVTNVVGPGLKLKSTIDAKTLGLTPEEKNKLERDIETLWELWTETEGCDMARMSNFSELQTQVMYSWLVYGEGVALLPYKSRPGDYFDLKVQLIDSLRLKNPLNVGKANVKNGIEIGDDGEFTAIHIESVDPTTKQKSFTRIDAFGNKTGRKNVLILMDRERVGQRVGVPLLAPVIEEIKQVGDWQRAEIEAAVTSSIFTFFIKNEHPESMTIVGRDGDTTAPQKGDPGLQIDVEPGSIYELAEGQDVSAPPTGRPVVAFDAFLMAITKTIGAAIEVPHEVLLSSFNSNYSASRAALLEVWKMYTTRRTRLKEKFCNPIFYEFMDEVIGKGYINVPEYFENPLVKKALLRNEWYGPIQGSLDPYKEAKADELDIKNMVKTRGKIVRERMGTSFEQTIEQIGVENDMIKEVLGEKVLGDE